MYHGQILSMLTDPKMSYSFLKDREPELADMLLRQGFTQVRA